jgi:predicted amidohydrolase
MDFQIAVVQFQPDRKNVSNNIKGIQSLLEGLKSDLVVLPELSNTGYLYENIQELQPFSESNQGDGLFLSSMAEIAKDIAGVIVTGYAEKDGRHLFNSAAAVCQDGVIANYRKTHLYADEQLLFEPGNSGFSTFEWKGVLIGMMICFDWIFPESVRTLALRGAQIIAHPANLVLPFCQDAMITRSIENKVFTITANRVGTERLGTKEYTFTGASQITHPKGNVLYRGPKDKTTVHILSIEPNEALDKHISEKNDLFADRKPHYYSD